MAMAPRPIRETSSPPSEMCFIRCSNCLGLLDFIGAVGTAFLATQALAIVHTDPPTSVFTQWPMVLFPAYLVPFSIILHITTIRVLLANRQACAGETYVGRHSEMTASG